MKAILFLLVTLLILVLAGCGGTTQTVNTNIHIPELDKTKYTDSPYEAGWESLKAGQPSEAIRHFQRSRTVDEKVYVGFGYAYLALGKLNLAQKNFEKALAIDSEYLPAGLGMATLYEELKEVDKAFNIYSNLRAKSPENAWIKVRYEYIKSTQTQTYLEKARVLKGSARRDEYIAALEKAASYSPEIIDIEIEIADFFNEDEKLQQAAFHFEKILEELPNRDDILVKLAGVYEKMEKYDSAVMIYSRLLILKPGEVTFINKINALKAKFYDMNLPEKFKNIFFKAQINREDLAALIGYYFEKQLETRSPVIITDISESFAKGNIIKICTLGIMKVRADHSFDRYTVINRSAYAVVIKRLLDYLQKDGKFGLRFTPLDKVVEPADISPLHMHYNNIKYLVNSQLIKLDKDGNFNPTAQVTPGEVLITIRKILNSIDR